MTRGMPAMLIYLIIESNNLYSLVKVHQHGDMKTICYPDHLQMGWNEWDFFTFKTLFIFVKDVLNLGICQIWIPVSGKN